MALSLYIQTRSTKCLELCYGCSVPLSMHQYREMAQGRGAFLLASAAAERIQGTFTAQALFGDGHCALPHAMTAQ